MRFDVREFNKEKSQQDLDKIFKELRGFENPLAIKNVEKKPKKKRR